MDMLGVRGACLFDRFSFDYPRGILFQRNEDDQLVQVNLGSRALSVLGVLIGRAGELVSKDDIMATVWPDTAVEEANLTVQISSLRRVLDAERSGGSCIQTIPGRGYRFIASVSSPPDDSVETLANAPAGQSSWRLPCRIASILAGAVLLATFVGTIAWTVHHGTASAHSGAQTTPARDRRQSAIVLPFENSSGDPAQDNLVAALTRGLTDRISMGSDGPVVPAVTAAAYRGKTADLAEIGQRYDVHFAVVGNGRRQSGRLIVSASVYDIARGKPVWTQHFDLPDGPGSQSQLVQNIYENYWQTSNDLEASWAISDHPGRLDAHDLALILLSTRLSTPTRDHYLDKMALAARILALDPNNRQGLERQARLHAEFVMLGYSADPASDLALAEQASDRLLAIDPNHLLTLRARTKVLLAKGDWPEAEAAVRRTIEIQPTEAMRHYELGIILLAEARPQEALQSLEDAKRFAGGSDPIYLFDARIAMAEVAIGRFADAIAAARASISGFPPDADRAAELPWLALIAATSNSGQGDAAREKLQRFLAAPRAGSNMAAIRNWPLLAADPNLLNGLRAAGMPDETAQP